MATRWILAMVSLVFNLRITVSLDDDSIYSGPYQVYSKGSNMLVMTNGDPDTVSQLYAYTDGQTVIALDIHYRLGLIFWISKGNQTAISMMALQLNSSGISCNGNPIILSTGKTLSSLTVDWISDMVYWTNTDDGQIEVYNITSGSKLVFLKTGLGTSPRGIAVDPFMRWIYWSDSQQQIIQRANTSNTGYRQVIKQYNGDPRCSSNTPWPIALNITSQMLYWAISCYSLIGQMIVSDVASTTLHVQTEGVVSSITYDSNWLWWAGGRTISKQDMNASTGAIKVCIAGQFAQYSALQVVDKNKQPNAPADCIPACMHGGVCTDPSANVCNCENTSWTGWRCESEIKLPVTPSKSTSQASTIAAGYDLQVIKMPQVPVSSPALKIKTTVSTTAAPSAKVSTTAAPSAKVSTTAAPSAKVSTTAAPSAKVTTTAAPSAKVSTTAAPSARVTSSASLAQGSKSSSIYFLGMGPSTQVAISSRVASPSVLVTMAPSIYMSKAPPTFASSSYAPIVPTSSLAPSSTTIYTPAPSSTTIYTPAPSSNTIYTPAPSSTTLFPPAPSSTTISTPAPFMELNISEVNLPIPSNAVTETVSILTAGGSSILTSSIAAHYSFGIQFKAGKSETPSVSNTISTRTQITSARSISNQTSIAIALTIVAVTAVLLLLITISFTSYYVKRRRLTKLHITTIAPEEIFPPETTMYNPVYISPEVVNPVYLSPGMSPVH